MQGKKKLIVVGLVVFAAFIVFAIPAATAFRWINPPGMQLSGLDGSIWKGRAAEGSVGGIYIRNIEWRFQPFSLLTGKIAFETHSEPGSGYLNGYVAISPGGTVTLRDVEGTLSLSTFQDFYQLKGFDGDVTIRFHKLRIEDGVPTEAVGTVELNNLLAAELSSRPIGDYFAEFSSDDDAVTAIVEDRSGVLDLKGIITINPDRSYSFVGQVSANSGAPGGLRRQLQFLGSPDANGKREFRVEGEL